MGRIPILDSLSGSFTPFLADKPNFCCSYIDKFLKLKQEADGWPSWVTSEADKDLYIQQYEEKEKILLDKDSIKKTPGSVLSQN